MANYFADTLKVKSVYVLDDCGAYGVGIADTFQKQAKKSGIKVLGRDQLNPKEADYTTILTKIKSLNPDALYYGGVAQAGVKLAKQAYDIMPKMIKGGGDGMHGADLSEGRRLPGGRGLVRDDRRAARARQARGEADWVERFKKKYGSPPEDYSMTAYDAALVIIDAIKRVAATRQGGQPRQRPRRDPGDQGQDPAGRGQRSTRTATSSTRSISVFQITKDDKYPRRRRRMHQYKYIGRRAGQPRNRAAAAWVADQAPDA